MFKKADPLSYPKQEKDKELLKNLLKYSLGAGLVGFGTGSMASIIRRSKRPDIDEMGADVPVEETFIPVRVKKKENIYKYAAENIFTKGIDTVAGKLSDAAGISQRHNPGGILDRTLANLRDHPWAIPAAALGIPATAYLGYRAASDLGDAFTERQDADDLEEAKKEYEAALSGKFKKQSNEKRSFDIYGGLSNIGKLITQAPDYLPGAYAAYAVPSAAVGALLGYSKYKDANRKAIARALKRREQLRAMESPPPVRILPRKIEEDAEE